MKSLVEIRAYKLKPGSLVEFDRLMREVSLPLLREWMTDVVAFGASTHENDTWFLIRNYVDLADRNARQNAFYGSQAWREGSRMAILALIDSYLDTVLWLTPAAIEDLRILNTPKNA